MNQEIQLIIRSQEEERNRETLINSYSKKGYCCERCTCCKTKKQQRNFNLVFYHVSNLIKSFIKNNNNKKKMIKVFNAILHSKSFPHL